MNESIIKEGVTMITFSIEEEKLEKLMEFTKVGIENQTSLDSMLEGSKIYKEVKMIQIRDKRKKGNKNIKYRNLDLTYKNLKKIVKGNRERLLKGIMA